jgi:hypothetical protein
MKRFRPVIQNSLLPVLLLLSLLGNVFAQTPNPDLVGVWISADNRHRIEIEANGHITTWGYETRISRGITAILVLEEEEKLHMLSDETFELTSQQKKTAFRFEIEETSSGDIKMSWIPLEAGLLEFKFTRLMFDRTQNDRENGSYQLHRNLAVFAKLMNMLENNNVAGFEKTLTSDEAKFLNDEVSLADKSTNAKFVRQRIWGEALSANNLPVVKLLVANLDIDVQAIGFGGATDPDLVAYLQNVAGIDNTALSASEVQHLNFLLSQFFYLEQPLVLKRLYSRHGGMSGDDVQGNAATNGPFSDAELAEENTVSQEARLNPKLWNQVTEEAFRICLKTFYQGQPISKKILNARTVPGKTFVKELTTPLYYFAVSTHDRQRRFYNYNVMKVLLEFGADPSVKPSADHPPLAAFMYANVEHQQFKDAISTSQKHPKWLSGRTARPGLLSVLAEIEAYNDVMKLIGGPMYGSEGEADAIRTAPAAIVKKTVPPPPGDKAVQPTPKIAESVQSSPLPQYWHLRIVPAKSGLELDPGVVAFWNKGMYINLRPDGNVSFNTDMPGPYFLDGNKNKWQQQNNNLSIQLGDIPYSLDLPQQYGESLSTVDSGPGSFRMLLVPKTQGQK